MNRRIILAGVSLVSALAGGAAGYVIASKRVGALFEERLKQELAAAEKVFQMKNKVGMYDSPVDVVKAKADASRAMYSGDEISDADLGRIITGIRRMPSVDPPGYETRTNIPVYKHGDSYVGDVSGNGSGDSSLLGFHDDDDEDPLSVHNVFSNGDQEQPDYEALRRLRSPDRPYILTQYEFMTNEVENKQSALSYFAGDEQLVDEHDEVIRDYEDVVGEDNLKHFGVWSNDPRIVYIRNERLAMDFEIALHDDSYSSVVLGFDEDEPIEEPMPRRRNRSADG